MAFGFIPLEKRLKDNIRNYDLDQLLDIALICDLLDDLNHATGMSLLLTDRHGEKAASAGNFLGFKPDTANTPGLKIRVYDRTVAHLYTKEEELTDEVKKNLVESLVKQLTDHALRKYEASEYLLYIDELEQKLEKEKYRATHDDKNDPLTGVLTNTHFEEKRRKIDDDATIPVAAICVNINDWKFVNDHFGDEESDRLIRIVASFMKEEAGSEYVIGRCGGDFFNVLIPYAEDGEAAQYCGRIQKKCLAFEDPHLSPSVACGYALKYNVEQSLNDVLSDAEYEMFNNKFEVKNAPGYRERLERVLVSGN